MKAIRDIFSQQQMDSLHGDDPRPLYFQLYTLLKNAVLNGTVEFGAQLPTEQQLAEYFKVSRITAKRAMDELAAERLIERRRGKGSHVIHQYQPQPVKAPLVGMLQEIESMARHSTVRVIECSEQQPPAMVRELMALSGNTTALHTIRVRSKDGEPFGYYDSWTQGLARPVTQREFQQKPRLEIFRNQGLVITHVSQTISAIAADELLARELDTAIGSPLISLVRLSYIEQPTEQLIDYLQLYYHPDRFQYRMDLRLEGE
jgi:GntR family transcriptional regulator